MPWKNLLKSWLWASKALLVLISYGLALPLLAQSVQKYTLAPKEIQSFRNLDSFTAIAIVDEQSTSLTRTVRINGSDYELVLDEHAPRPTYFISLPVTGSAFEIRSLQNQIEVYTINSGPIPEFLQKSFQEETHCLDVDDAIPQSDWRAGLPEPNYSRSFHSVTHHIVHHTAGSNSNDNYVQVVRDIYLFHTEVNGWSDIGYNFLIAQDGTLFEGRDPGSNGSEFEVRGAHFCGKNTGTFGVALLGNYETTRPTAETIERLVNLLTLSLSTLEIHPLSSSVHRGVDLRAISGHRDGCSTLCPGTNVYAILPDIRAGVLESIQHCAGTLSLSFEVERVVNTGDSVTFNNTSLGYQNFSWTFEGGSPATSQEPSPKTFYRRAGLYDVTFYGETDGVIDSLFLDNHIQVMGEDLAPLIFPNPVDAGNAFTIDFEADIDEAQIYFISGNLASTYAPEDTPLFQAPSEPGVYLLLMKSEGEQYVQKLIVR